jgi:DNA-binding MarR family transcriptional regulator
VGDSNLTGIIGRLEERGVVARVHDDADRRMVRAQLTAAGVDMLRRVEDARLGHMRQLVESLSADEQRTVLSGLKTLTAAHARTHDEHDHPEQHPTPSDKELLPT